MRYDDEMEVAGDVGRSELLAKLLVPVGVAGHVLFYDLLPAALTWVVGSPHGLDLFSAFDGFGVRPAARSAAMADLSASRSRRNRASEATACTFCGGKPASMAAFWTE